MFSVLFALIIAFAALLTFRAWLKPIPVQAQRRSLPLIALGSFLSGTSLLMIFFGPLWAALTLAVGWALYISAIHFGPYFLAGTKGRSRSVQSGIIVLWSMQLAGFVYAFVAIAFTFHPHGAT